MDRLLRSICPGFLSFAFGAHAADIELSRKLKQLQVFYLSCLLFLPFFIARQLIYYHTADYLPVLVPWYLVLVGSPWVYRKTGNYFLSSGLTSGLGIGLIIVLIGLAGGNQAPGVFWLTAAPLVFGILFGLRGVLAGAGVMAGSVIGFHLLDQAGVLPNLAARYDTYNTEKLVNLVGFGLYGVVTSYYFIDVEKKAQIALAEQKRETENLLRILVHDVAPPLSVIGLMTHAARSGHPNAADAIVVIETAQHEITAIIEKVRQLYAVNIGMAAAASEPVEINQALENTVALLRTKADAKGVSLSLARATEDVFVLAEEPILRNVIFANPIANAIKFSHPGQAVGISVSAHDGVAVVDIVDRGIGIPADLMRELFTRTRAVSRSGTAGETGTGFGMQLTKAYAGKLGGSLEVNSPVEGCEGGTRVRITLPSLRGQRSTA